MTYFLDVECYPNFFMVGLKDTVGRYSIPSRDKMRSLLRDNRFVTFNGVRYDFPMVTAWLELGDNPSELFKISKSIIENRINDSFRNLKNRFIYKTGFDLVDLIDIAPGVMVSLKMYGARMHYPFLQDLPYAPETELTEEQQKEVIKYNKKDLDITQMLYEQLRDEIQLRDDLKTYYKTDQNLNIKGNAALGEWLTIKNLRRNPTVNTKSVEYKAPKEVQFKLDIPPISIDDTGKPVLPPFKSVKIGNTTYKIGLGGLHSQEKDFISGGDTVWNADVTSFYPSLILEYQFKPESYGSEFLTEYQRIYKERVKAKETGNKLINAAYKLALNSVFGKLGNKYSPLYDPQMLLQVTLTGQLMLLDLIVALEKEGHSVLSANTDGIEFQPVSDPTLVLNEWQARTRMKLEVNQYNKLYARDVNNYIAVWGNKLKCKGIYAESDLKKSWEHPVVFDAVKNYILYDKPVKQTIYECKDLKRFLLIRNVTGGCVYRNEYKGRIARWYYSKTGEPIFYAKNGNKVAKSDNAVFVDELRGIRNIDRDYYVNLALNTFPLMYI